MESLREAKRTKFLPNVVEELGEVAEVPSEPGPSGSFLEDNEESDEESGSEDEFEGFLSENVDVSSEDDEDVGWVSILIVTV